MNVILGVSGNVVIYGNFDYKDLWKDKKNFLRTCNANVISATHLETTSVDIKINRAFALKLPRNYSATFFRAMELLRIPKLEVSERLERSNAEDDETVAGKLVEDVDEITIFERCRDEAIMSQ
jgi:hypothetical protein